MGRFSKLKKQYAKYDFITKPDGSMRMLLKQDRTQSGKVNDRTSISVDPDRPAPRRRAGAPSTPTPVTTNEVVFDCDIPEILLRALRLHFPGLVKIVVPPFIKTEIHGVFESPEKMKSTLALGTTIKLKKLCGNAVTLTPLIQSVRGLDPTKTVLFHLPIGQFLTKTFAKCDDMRGKGFMKIHRVQPKSATAFFRSLEETTKIVSERVLTVKGILVHIRPFSANQKPGVSPDASKQAPKPSLKPTKKRTLDAVKNTPAQTNLSKRK